MQGDREIVLRILDGDARAFQLLVKQHERLVWHVVLRILHNEDDVKDLCQEVFIKVFQKLTSFQFNSKLSTWIATIAYRMAIDKAKKNKNLAEQGIDPEDHYAFFVDDQDPGNLLEEEDLNNYVKILIDKLPTHFKTVLTLYHLHEFNYKEIYDITGLPEGTVKSYLFRARKLLKESITKHLSPEVLF